VLLLVACSPPPIDPPSGETRDLTFFLRRLRTLEHLPQLERSHTAMASTWDRSGGNEDGLDFRRIEGDRNILLDVDGPGCVHRIHTGLLGDPLEGARIQILLDHDTRPLIDLPVDQFFSEQQGPFPYPLTTNGTLPGTHFPIPFAEHCRVQLVNPAAVKRWGVIWQLTYTRYDTPVRSLRLPLDPAEREELDRVIGRWIMARQPAPPPTSWSVQRTLALSPGGRGQVSLQGCGVIRELRVATLPATPEVLQGVRLRIHWDGIAAPSVDTPLGAFFGHSDVGHVQQARFDSLLLGVTEREAYTRLPMPFSDGATLGFDNNSEAQVEVQVRLQLDRCQQLPADHGRLHATWHRTLAATAAAPLIGPLQIPAHRVLEQSGRGKYVGALLQLHWPFWPQWWGEGDWLVWTDEQDWPPSYHGTGTEEYFNSGWTMFERSAISGFVSVRPGPVGLYSFHLNDGFSFDSSIRILLETVGSYGGHLLIPQLHPAWRTTALWYGLPARAAGSDTL